MSASPIAPLAEGGQVGPKNPGTQRKDNWALEPWLVFLGLAAFAVYATWRAFAGFVDPTGGKFLTTDHHAYLEAMGYAYYGNGAHYISPFASPDLSPILAPIVAPINQLVQNLTGWTAFVVSPALWILWVPGGFRLTCYYYRKAYYRAFFNAPSACAVNAKITPTAPLASLLGNGKGYRGETIFPIIMQNFHRYFFYISALFILILSVDALISYFFRAEAILENGKVAGHIYHPGITVGSLVLTLNAVLLGLYTFSCHSWRHLLGGMLDSFSACGAVGMARHHAWQRQSFLNEHHMLFAWLSLFWVGFTDFYIWQVAQGHIPDIQLLMLSGINLRLPF